MSSLPPSNPEFSFSIVVNNNERFILLKSRYSLDSIEAFSDFASVSLVVLGH